MNTFQLHNYKELILNNNGKIEPSNVTVDDLIIKKDSTPLRDFKNFFIDHNEFLEYETRSNLFSVLTEQYFNDLYDFIDKVIFEEFEKVGYSTPKSVATALEHDIESVNKAVDGANKRFIKSGITTLPNVDKPIFISDEELYKFENRHILLFPERYV